jgi:mono/diheme cytochrome c family protein
MARWWGRRDWRVGIAGLATLAAVGGWMGTAGEPARAQNADQVQTVGQVYAAHCARCHGDQGQGAGPDSADAPLVVGSGALTGFRNAQELHTFVADSMPEDAPGSLSASDYWAVSAWMLAQNNVALPSAALDSGNAAGVAIGSR